MSVRLLIVVIPAAVVLAGLAWLVPVAGLLSSPGYALQQVVRPVLGEPPLTETPDPVPRPRDDRTAGTDAGDDHAARAPDTQPADEGGEPGAADTPQPETAPTRLTTSSTVNVRGGHGTEFDVVGRIAPGETVVVSEDPGGKWVRIRAGDVQGWVYRPLFEKVER